MKTLFSIAFFINLSVIANAQGTPGFYVINVKGSGFYMRDKYQIPLKIGAALAFSDRLTLNSQSSVTIICNNYSLFTIVNNQSVIKQIILRKYNDSCGSPNSGVTTKFLKYLWQHFHEEDVAINSPDQNNIKEYGGTERGCGDEAFNRIRDTITIYQKPFSIKYYPLDTAAENEFVIFDEETLDTLYKAPVHNDRINISDNLIHLLDTEKIYHWVIIRNGMQLCNVKTVQKITTSKYNSILSPFDKKNFNVLSKTEKVKAIAFLLNEKNVVAEAIYYLKMAKGRNGDILYKILEEDLKNQFTE